MLPGNMPGLSGWRCKKGTPALVRPAGHIMAYMSRFTNREEASQMELLKQRILKDGTELGTEIVKVDSFLNHQLDVGLFMALGKEIHCRFGNLGVNKILTIESSGIGIAVITAMYFDLVPVVFAKKTQPSTMTEEFYGAPVKSFTKGTVSIARVAKKYLHPEDRVLIIDDFLAHGEAAAGLCSLVEQAGGKVCGIAAVIEKEFQGGGAKLRQAGYYVNSLSVITKIENGKIFFKDEAGQGGQA